MSDEFLLRWNDYLSSVSSMMESICLKEEMTDCTISNGSKSFCAHRMVLSTCSPYFRSLFSTLPHTHHPVIFIKDIEDGIVELLVRYMYSGQVSVTQDQLIPLVEAGRSLAIKGLLDVPVPRSGGEARQEPRLRPPPLKKPKIKQEPVSKSEDPLSQELKTKNTSDKIVRNGRSTAADKSMRSVCAEGRSTRLVCAEDRSTRLMCAEDEENSLDEDGAQSEPELQNQHELLQRLTSEITAYPFVACGGEPSSPTQPRSGASDPCSPNLTMTESNHLTIYSCEHCGKEFTSKRKHQRHVLNVHFGYNPVQCPYCNKGHRDNYNLKQHVCPVLNMKYGQFEKKGDTDTNTGGLVSEGSDTL